MASQHLDKLVRSFLSDGRNNTTGGYNAFTDIQDPTFLSFKLDFFPDLGFSFPDDAYSSGGLFRGASKESTTNYGYFDSAADYLRRIGAPKRQLYLEVFVNLLSKIQNEAPWYFQSVTGVGDLYKIDPAINYRGKDKVLTVECLESLDLRISLLADLYRNIAFDFQGMREVLPINLRTFNMAVHVLEFRRFNTTFGILADQISSTKEGAQRTTQGQDKQQEDINSKRRNVFNQGSSALFTGTFDNLNSLSNNLNSQLGGLFTNLGQQAGAEYDSTVKSAFEAISIETFFLKDCEFDFFSEAPGYLDSLSVKEIPEAAQKFKIKIGKIQKTGYYPFYNYAISEYAKFSRISRATAENLKSSSISRSFPNISNPYFEQASQTDALIDEKAFRNIRESIFPTAGDLQSPEKASADAYAKSEEESDKLRKRPLERLVGGILRNSTSYIRSELNEAIGELTGGVVGTAPLGNIYEDPSFFNRATEALNDFLTPGNQLTSGQRSNLPPSQVLGNIAFEALNIDSSISENVGFTPPPTESTITDDNILVVTPTETTFTRSNIYQDAVGLPTPQPVEENVFNGVPGLPTVETPSENVFLGTPGIPSQASQSENVFEGAPELPTGEIQTTNVFSDASQVSNQTLSENVFSGDPGLPTNVAPSENVFLGTPETRDTQINNENVFE